MKKKVLTDPFSLDLCVQRNGQKHIRIWIKTGNVLTVELFLLLSLSFSNNKKKQPAGVGPKRIVCWHKINVRVQKQNQRVTETHWAKWATRGPWGLCVCVYVCVTILTKRSSNNVALCIAARKMSHEFPKLQSENSMIIEFQQKSWWFFQNKAKSQMFHVFHLNRLTPAAGYFFLMFPSEKKGVV